MEEDPNGNMPVKREKNAAEIRKSNKPLMEKRRRERINTCLDQLKSILMEVTKKESSYYSKLEKADILEMTVKYLKNFKRQQLAAAMATDPSVLGKYVAGFNECTSEVSKYLQSVDGLSTDIRARMLNHLASSLQRTNVVNTTTAAAAATSLQLTLNQPQPMALQIPSATPFSTLPGAGGLCVLNTGPGSLQTSAMQLVPAKLPSGDTVYLLANPQTLTLAGGNANITHTAVTMASMVQAMQPLPLTIPPPVMSPLNSPQSSIVSPSSPTTPMQVIAPASSTSACADGPEPSTSGCSYVEIPEWETVNRKIPDSSDWDRVSRQRPETPDSDDTSAEEEDRINNNNNDGDVQDAEAEDQAMWRPW